MYFRLCSSLYFDGCPKWLKGWFHFIFCPQWLFASVRNWSCCVQIFDLWLLLAGSSVAQLKAVDPEEEPLLFGVTGEESMRFFSVNPDTGVVWLRQQLDREVQTPHISTSFLHLVMKGFFKSLISELRRTTVIFAMTCKIPHLLRHHMH